MMEMRRDEPASGPQIVGIVGHGFKVRHGAQESVFDGGIMLSPRDCADWLAPDPASLTADDLAGLCAVQPAPEFLILGTGAHLVPPPRAFARTLEARGIGLEVMDSRAAARAWAVLRAEDRWIIAALMPL